MRSFFLLCFSAFFLLSAFLSSAQEVRFDCNGFIWKEEGQEQMVEEDSYFILAANGLELMHFTPNIVSFYFNDGWHYDEQQQTIETKVVSDADNRYRVRIDEPGGKIHFWFLEGPHKDVEVIFYIRNKM